MKKISFVFILLIFAANLFGGVLATYQINNKTYKFTDKDLNVYLQNIPPQFRSFIVKDKVKYAKNILFQKIAAVEAKKIGVDKDKEVQKEIKTQIERVLAKHYIEKTIGDYKFSDKELKEYYNKNKSSFKQKAGYKFGRVKFDNLDDALKAFKEIQKKKNFEKFEGLNNSPMAKIIQNRYEPAERLPKKLVKILNNLKIGEVSAPFEFKGKYFIVKLRDKRKNGVSSFSEVKDRIKNILMQKKRREVMEKIKEDLLKKYNVKLSK